MRTIAIVNQKGGCGKTTTAINLGAALGRAGLRTLLVDLDPQGHCAAGLGIPEARIELDASDLLQAAGEQSLEASRLLWRAARNLDVIPSRIRLAGLEAPGSSFGRREGRERALASALRELAGRFDACLIDCPPTIGLLTFNALVAADLVLVPVETGYFSLQGAARQLTTVRALARRLETEIRCAVVPTLHEAGLAVAEDLLAELLHRFGGRVLPVTIHRDAALREAASFGRPVCEHAPDSEGARDYAALASVLIDSERLTGSAPEDWADVEAADQMPVRRPGSPAPAPTPRTNGHSNGAGDPEFASAVGLHAPLLGEVVVTFPGGELHTGLAMRVREAAPPVEDPRGSRAEDIVRRAAMLRAPAPAARPAPVGNPSPIPAAAPAKPAPKPPTSAARRVFGCQRVASGVLFAQPGALGRAVAVAGGFSGWSPVAMTLEPEAGVHELRLCLPPGRHEYRLVVDGHWIADPYNTDWILNEFGEPHSIIEVPEIEDPVPECDTRCGAD